MKEIEDKVYNFKTKNKEGFIHKEIEELLKDYPNINMEKFNEALFGNTCMIIDGDLVQYHCDIYKALICGVENRSLYGSELD